MAELIVDRKRVPVSTCGEPLLDVLRQNGVTAPKRSCGRGECGACTVLVGDRAVLACVTLADLVEGEVTTARGLGDASDDLRAAFADHGAFQCGFCTPGQIVRAEALLRESTRWSRQEVCRGMAGNICRCTGYVQIVDAVCAVARSRRERQEVDL